MYIINIFAINKSNSPNIDVIYISMQVVGISSFSGDFILSPIYAFSSPLPK